MKRFVLLMLILITGSTVFSQGIEFQKESYTEVLKMAKKQNKLVFIDVYTSWCGPCKHMANTIFPQAKVGEYYNSHFLNLQLDAEKSEDGKMVAKTFGVSAYPTFLFVNGDGELVYRFLGGRAVDMFIKEGEKAVDAFAALPELKKYMKKYEEGNRDKDFLNQYFILKDRSGLDCSDVLLDYFALVDDSQLLDSINVPRIGKITVFDKKLANRFVDAACALAANPTKDKKHSTAVNKSICTFLSACVQKTAQADQEENFEEVLALKDRLFKATGAKNSATAASLGGGNIYIPSELLRLNYYSAKKKLDKFNHLFINYIAELQKQYEETRDEKIAMLKAMEAKLKEAKESGNDAEYQAAKKLNAMMSAFSNIDDYYTSTSMIENVERYEEIYEGTKDAAYKDRVAGWYVFLHQLSPSAKTATYVADKLVALDKKELAKEVLTLGLKDGSSAAGVEEEDVKACQAKLDELE
ncbi:MAG TPA: thioredoxin family protein [Candidatus Butyricimonas faecavium]|nr:thioredoxin family protein [Candidatus Butyricimonas faecavium]